MLRRTLTFLILAILPAPMVLAGPHDAPIVHERHARQARPRVTWRPYELRERVAWGMSYTFTASFASTQDLTDVELRLTPSIARFATLDSASFAHVPAHTPTEVTITLHCPEAPPEELLRDTFAGLVHMRAAGRPLHTALRLRFHVAPQDPTSGDPLP